MSTEDRIDDLVLATLVSFVPLPGGQQSPSMGWMATHTGLRSLEVSASLERLQAAGRIVVAGGGS